MEVFCFPKPADVTWVVRCESHRDIEFGSYEDAIKKAKELGKSISADLIVFERHNSVPRRYPAGTY